MNVSLSPELEELINIKVASGRYSSPGEVIREGLRLLQEQDELYRIRFDELKREIDIGLAEAERGELIAGDEVFARIKAKNKDRLHR